MSLVQLEKGLKIYYDTFKLKYDNQFSATVEDSGMDEDDLKEEMEHDATDFTLSDFDEKFPLYPEIEDEQQRTLEIFRICNNCYKYGQPPTVTHPPRGPHQKIPFFDWYQDMNFIRMRMKFLSDNVLNSPDIDFSNKDTFKLVITAETFYVSVDKEYEIKFNFRYPINVDTVQHRNVILGKMLEFVFEKYQQNKYWEHLLIDFHKTMYKQHCKIHWDHFLDKDEAIKKEKGILNDDENDIFEKYRNQSDDDDDEKKEQQKAIEPPKKEKVKQPQVKEQGNVNKENDDMKEDKNNQTVDQTKTNTQTDDK